MREVVSGMNHWILYSPLNGSFKYSRNQIVSSKVCFSNSLLNSIETSSKEAFSVKSESHAAMAHSFKSDPRHEDHVLRWLP